MRRGEIYYADLGRTVGSEINKRRPVLIVSNDANNRAAGTVTVLPMTSNISHVYPFELLIDPKESGLPKPSKVQAQQIRTIAKERITGAPPRQAHVGDADASGRRDTPALGHGVNREHVARMKRSGIRVGVPGFVWRGLTVVNLYRARRTRRCNR